MSESCWTCRDRKVRCDLRQPTCTNCLRSKRRCIGYGFRLAWPRPGHNRRSLFYVPHSAHMHSSGEGRPDNLVFINASSEDVRISYDLLRLRPCRRRSSNLKAPAAKYLPFSGVDVEERAMARLLPGPRSVTVRSVRGNDVLPLDHFLKSRATIFSALNGDVLAPLLFKMAMSDNSSSSKAVLHAILALSCSHLRRDTEAVRYRASAVSLLSSSLIPDTDVKNAFQNIATSMLLCMFEVNYASETFFNWAVYLCGVKKIIIHGLTTQKINDTDHRTLRDWIYFYEVMARFTLLHWLGRPERYPICYQGPMSTLIETAKAQSENIASAGFSRPIFECISELNDLHLPAKTLHWTPVERQRLVSDVERRLLLLKRNENYQPHNPAIERQPRATVIDHVYLLAALIYLNRTSLQYPGADPQHRQLVKTALSCLGQVQVHEVPWAFFIIGCEAQTDVERKQVLRQSSAQSAEGGSDSANWVRRMVEASWNQDDLDAEQSLSYLERMSAVISACPFLPVFV